MVRSSSPARNSYAGPRSASPSRSSQLVPLQRQSMVAPHSSRYSFQAPSQTPYNSRPPSPAPSSSPPSSLKSKRVPSPARSISSRSSPELTRKPSSLSLAYTRPPSPISPISTRCPSPNRNSQSPLLEVFGDSFCSVFTLLGSKVRVHKFKGASSRVRFFLFVPCLPSQQGKF